MKSLELTDEGLRGTSSIRLRPETTYSTVYYGTAEQLCFYSFSFFFYVLI